MNNLNLKKDIALKIQLNTDAHIEGTEALAAKVNTIIKIALARFEEHITRIEVHLNDSKNGQIGQHDYRCMLEARLEGRKPLAVTEHAASIEQAVQGATQKLDHLLGSTLGRLYDRSSRKDIMSEGVEKIPRQILRLGRGNAGSKIPDSLLGELRTLNCNKDESS
jgi:histidinol phosphatase-like PHP family hydrolase